MYANPFPPRRPFAATARAVLTMALSGLWLCGCSNGPPPEPPPALALSATPTTQAQTQPANAGTTTPASTATPSVSSTASAPASGDKPAAATLSVMAVDMPSGLRVDGKLTEWGKGAGEADIVVAASKDKLVVALPKKAQQAFSLAAVALPPPDIGWAHRVNYTHELTEHRCKVEQHYVGEASFRDGAPLPPEVAKRCLALMADHNTWVKRYHAQFIRHFHVHDGMLEVIGDSGAQDVAGAKVATSPAGTELTIPLAAWPALSEAPLKRLFFATGEDAHKLLPPLNGEARGWTEATLAKPLSFGAYPGLLATLFGRGDPNESMFGANRLTPDLRVISYHPSEPQTLRRVVPVTNFGGRPTGRLRDPITRPSISESKEPIFTERMRQGNVQVGITKSVADYFVALKDGKFSGIQEITGDVKTLVRRGGGFHFIIRYDGGIVTSLGHQIGPPSWRIITVDKQGKVDEVDLHDLKSSGPNISCYFGQKLKAFGKAPFTLFGEECTVEKKRYRITFQWVAGKNHYERRAVQLQR